MNQRAFQIPIRVQPERQGEVKELILYMSSNHGGKWEVSGRADPSKSKVIDFLAPNDGLYYLNVATIDARTGKQDPVNVYNSPVQMKVHVDTAPPHIQGMSVSKHDGRLVVAWRVAEENPKLESLTLEYKLVGGENWRPVLVESKLLTSKASLPADLDAVDVAEVRLRVSDLAQNEAVKILPLR